MSRIDREAPGGGGASEAPPHDGLEDNPYALTRGDRDHAGQYRRANPQVFQRAPVSSRPGGRRAEKPESHCPSGGYSCIQRLSHGLG